MEYGVKWEKCQGIKVESVFDERNQLKLWSLENKRRKHWLCVLTLILQTEGQLCTLFKAYGEIAKDRQLVSVITQATAREKPTSLSNKKQLLRKFPAENYFWDA